MEQNQIYFQFNSRVNLKNIKPLECGVKRKAPYRERQYRGFFRHFSFVMLFQSQDTYNKELEL